MLTRATEKPDASAHKDRRLRAVYRRELQNSVFVSALIVSAGMAAAAVAGVIVAPAAGLAYPVLVLPLVIAAVLAAMNVRRTWRRYVVQLGMLVGLLPLLNTVLSIVFVRPTEFIALGTLGLIPVAFAIFVPLERRPHLVWLSLAGIVFLQIFLSDAAYRKLADTAIARLGAGLRSRPDS